MSGAADGATTTFALARAGSGPVPVTRSRGVLTFVLPLPVAAAAGLGAGLSAHAALVVAGAVTSAFVLSVRLDWAALAVICTAVFEDYLDLVSSWTTEWLAGLLLVAWLVRRAQGPLHDHRLRVVAVSIGLLVGAVLIGFVAHPNGAPGLASCARYAGLAVVMLVLTDCLCGPLAPRRAARLYVLSCVLASCCGILTAVVSDRHQVAGPVANADTLAFFLVAAVPLVGTVRASASQPVWWVWAGSAVLMTAVVGTQSRPAFVALVAMVLVAAVTGLLALRYAGALLAIATTGVAFVLALFPLPIGQALTDPERYSDTNVAQRMDAREAALEMTAASPVVGLGPAAYELFHQDYRDPDDDPVGRDLDQAYSTPLEVSAELGVLGLAALYAVWLVPAIGARRRWLGDRSRLTGATLLAFDGLLTASVLDSEQYALPLWFLAAMTCALGRPTRPRTPLFAAGLDRRSSGQVGARS